MLNKLFLINFASLFLFKFTFSIKYIFLVLIYRNYSFGFFIRVFHVFKVKPSIIGIGRCVVIDEVTLNHYRVLLL
ncbi:hypothetical protein VIGAN_04218600 [Vigna angularis var. angularis]|uniref:Uncharacterized protein n=1 Tax=Vigna angularis var. angularis TaxID=157739 RepID=A0A0S3RVY0_PHAAN|nr:hypothetical protein VIGAN_04218600 [Vigna angularis var. angularis]